MADTVLPLCPRDPGHQGEARGVRAPSVGKDPCLAPDLLSSIPSPPGGNSTPEEAGKPRKPPNRSLFYTQNSIQHLACDHVVVSSSQRDNAQRPSPLEPTLLACFESCGGCWSGPRNPRKELHSGPRPTLLI